LLYPNFEITRDFYKYKILLYLENGKIEIGRLEEIKSLSNSPLLLFARPPKRRW